MNKRTILLLVAATTLAGCAVGPDYVRPTAVTAAAGPFVGALGAPFSAEPLPERWWALYEDPALDRLVETALAANTDIRQAVARLDRARGVLAEARGDLLPTTEPSGGTRYRRGNVNGPGATGLTGSGATGGNANQQADGARVIYSVGLDVAYEMDLFGRVRRGVETARADTEAEAAAVDYTRVTVAAETTRAYLGACATAERLAVARSGLEVADRALAIAERQQRLGALTRAQVERLDAVREQASAVLPPIENDRRAALFNLALLTGKPPADVDTAASSCRRAPHLGRPLPVGDGAALLSRRPDVREAERRLAARTASIGVATAELYPRIVLGGSAVAAGPSLGAATSRSGFSFALGPLLSWSFPNVVAARARIAQAEASTREALAAFDGTWLGALNETERALVAFSTEAERNTSLRRAVERQARAYGIIVRSAELGATSPTDVLDTERILIAARNDLAASDALLLDRGVTLFKALGGGWSSSARIKEGVGS